MLTFNKNYLSSAILLLTIEVLIALFVHDGFVRPYVGDALVVILIYCSIKTFLQLPMLPTATAVLLLSFTVELLQFIDVVERLGLGASKIARLVIGTSFSWIDLLSYLTGTAAIIIVERHWLKNA